MQRQIRSESEKILDILRSIRNCPGTRITQIMFETCIPHNQLKGYLAIMIQNGLIVYVKEEKTFTITDYGMHILKLYDKMDKLLVYNPTKQLVE
jgi:predicted transcriptional regulator